MRILVFWVLYWRPPIQGKVPYGPWPRGIKSLCIVQLRYFLLAGNLLSTHPTRKNNKGFQNRTDFGSSKLHSRDKTFSTLGYFFPCITPITPNYSIIPHNPYNPPTLPIAPELKEMLPGHDSVSRMPLLKTTPVFCSASSYQATLSAYVYPHMGCVGVI